MKTTQTYKIGDCLELMKDMPDESIDLILTDPPYGINYQSNYRKRKFKHIQNDLSLDWFDIFAYESYRVLKKNTALYCFSRADVYPYMYMSLTKHGFKFKNMIIIPKTTQSNGDLEASFNTNNEIVIYMNKGRRPLNETTIKKISTSTLNDKRNKNKSGYVKRLPTIWDWCTSGQHNLKMIHPTQKSIVPIIDMILISSNEYDSVLDPFLGSGTSLIGCRETNRNGIGFEINPDYEPIIRKRLMADVPSLDSYLTIA